LSRWFASRRKAVRIDARKRLRRSISLALRPQIITKKRKPFSFDWRLDPFKKHRKQVRRLNAKRRLRQLISRRLERVLTIQPYRPKRPRPLKRQVVRAGQKKSSGPQTVGQRQRQNLTSLLLPVGLLAGGLMLLSRLR